MTNPATLLSALLLLFGANKLPPRDPHLRPGRTCPLIEAQPNFNIRRLIGPSFYFNFGTAAGNALKRFNCLKLRVEERDHSLYLHISGLRKQERRVEQAWHRLIPAGKPGHFEVDLRVNGTDHESDAFIYFDHAGRPDVFYLFLCVRFNNKNKHAIGGVIATSRPTLSANHLPREIARFQELIGVVLPNVGFAFKNRCPHPHPLPY